MGGHHWVYTHAFMLTLKHSHVLQTTATYSLIDINIDGSDIVCLFVNYH